ncbi:MAG: hypothetical protein AAFY28_15705, partial [Actinomycetota bacterium]
IGRTKAYEQARLYLDTNGEDGLPCIRVGDSIRFLRHGIEDLIGAPIATEGESDDDRPSAPAPPRPKRRHSTVENNPQLFSA